MNSLNVLVSILALIQITLSRIPRTRSQMLWTQLQDWYSVLFFLTIFFSFSTLKTCTLSISNLKILKSVILQNYVSYAILHMESFLLSDMITHNGFQSVGKYQYIVFHDRYYIAHSTSVIPYTLY